MYLSTINIFRLYYVSKEKREGLENSWKCIISPSERVFAIVSSFICLLAVVTFFALTWIYGFDIGGAFGKACLYPDATFKMKTFGTFGKIWIFAGICVVVNLVGILVSTALYFWLKLQDNSMLKNAKVCDLSCIQIWNLSRIISYPRCHNL